MATEKDRPWHAEKPTFGGLYLTKGSKYIYISVNYFKQRLRFPTDREDTEENWQALVCFLNKVGEKIKKKTFKFAECFFWLDDRTKAHFTALEGGDYRPEPEHVLFGDYAERWLQQKMNAFTPASKLEDYQGAIRSRLIPYFGKTPFSGITASEMDRFISSLVSERGKTKGEYLSPKRTRNLLLPMKKIWKAACCDYNWNLRDPFEMCNERIAEMNDRKLEEKARVQDLEEMEISSRDVLLLSEWLKLLSFVDPHYHPAMECLLMGMIGSELTGLQKKHIRGDAILVRCSVVKGILKHKPKNWYRKRDLPISKRLRKLLSQAEQSSTNTETITFKNGITVPASEFVFTMKDGSPFIYSSFRKTIWDKALEMAGIAPRVPYASRHTLVQWALIIGVTPVRLVSLMGHCDKKMIFGTYGDYRSGLVDERQKILDYLGEDFLAEEELRTAFPERIRVKTVMENIMVNAKAPVLPVTFGQSVGQIQGLYPDNYLK
jgi:integrase